MKLPFFAIGFCLLLGACVYAEGPDGRFAAIDLPVQNSTTINKTVTVNAPAGTTVILQDTPPPTVIYRDRPRPMRVAPQCYYDQMQRRRICNRY